MREEMEIMWQAMKGSHYKRTIEKLSASIRQTGNLQDALQTALETVVKAIHAETGTLWFYDRFDTGRIYPRAVCDDSDLSGISLAPGEGIAGQVIDSGKSVIIKDCQADSRWAGSVDEKTGFTTRSMICVPLILGEQSFGSIQIINNRSGQLFDEKDLTFTEHLATEIALTLKEQGLLEDYFSQANEPEASQPLLTFRELFLEGSVRDMERKIYGLTDFAALPHHRQQEVLKLCSKLRECFGKHRN